MVDLRSLGNRGWQHHRGPLRVVFRDLENICNVRSRTETAKLTHTCFKDMATGLATQSVCGCICDESLTYNVRHNCCRAGRTFLPHKLLLDRDFKSATEELGAVLSRSDVDSDDITNWSTMIFSSNIG
jgi:hypothetical protein